MKAFYMHHDKNEDGILDCVLVLTKDYNEPLIGDYKGVQIAIIPYSNEFGKKRAEELARVYTKVVEPLQPFPDFPDKSYEVQED